MKVGVFGANGFVGSRLVPALVSRGHDVVALTRSPDRYDGAGEPIYADLDDPLSLAPALTGCDGAYLLTHALGKEDFEKREAALAEGLAAAVDEVGLNQLVFLSGLGRDDDSLSPHLRSRRAVDSILRQARVPITLLRKRLAEGTPPIGTRSHRTAPTLSGATS